ncbi:MAG: AMP-binding protein, partial [Betaproteobacteria bacterium]
MPELSSVDHSTSPPRVHFPREYNAAHDLIQRNLLAGRGGKNAFIDDAGSYSYVELSRRVNRFANAITALGVQPEQRVLLCLLDSIDFPVAFLGCILAGVIPVAANTLLTTDDYDYMLRDSRARALIVSDLLWPKFAPIVQRLPRLQHIVLSGTMPGACEPKLASFSELCEAASEVFAPQATSPDEACFWLYSSGSTGAPKGT